MRHFLIRRLIQSALLLWLLMTFTFGLVRLTPGGPESAFLQQPDITQADIDRVRERLGLNDPLPIAYAKWLASVARLDFGRSYHYLRPTTEVILERVGPTIQLGAVAYLFALVGVPLGVIAALHRGRTADVVIRVFTLVGDAVPHWWLALLAIITLSSVVGWFPQGQGLANPLDWLQHITLPALILGSGPLVAFTRYVRSQVLEVLGQEHVRTARAKGLLETFVVTRHVLRNALLPVITLLGGLLPHLVSGAALVEGIFNWPGVGRLYLEAASTRDYPLLLAILILLTSATLLGTLAADVLYGLADPRIRYV